MRNFVRPLKFIAGLLCSSCVVVTDNGMLDNTSSSGRTFEQCEPIVDALPASDMAGAAEKALAQLKTRGVLPADIWANAAEMKSFMAIAHKEAGCEVTNSGVSQQALHDGIEPQSFCGMGHGVLTLSVSTCLNDACKKHDACYATCSAETGFGCWWNDVTADCDQQAYARADSCVDDTRRYRSFLIRLLMRLLHTDGRGSCDPEMSCPGRGPCVVDRKAALCTACLSEKDAGCMQRACPNGVGSACDISLLANCPDVGACFGRPFEAMIAGGGMGGMTGVAGMAGSPSTDPSPIQMGGAGGQASTIPSQRWALSIIQAQVPDTKPDGLPWDAEGAYVAPDPFIRVRVGAPDAQVKVTSTQVDTFLPQWQADPGVFVAASTEFANYVSFEMWDSDIVFNDLIGRCETTIEASAFDGQPHVFDCVVSGALAFSVTYRLVAESTLQ